MAPGSGKRKRPQDDSQTRPSPHHPETLNLAQQNQRSNNNNRGRNSQNSHNYNNNNNNNNRSQTSTPTQNRHGNFSQQSPAMSSPSQHQQPRPVSPTRQPTPAAAAAATPASNRPTPTPAPVSSLPQYAPTRKQPPAPYAYDYLTDDAVSAWKAKGRQSVLDALEQAEDKEAVTSVLIQELLRTVLDGRLSASETAEVLRQVASGDELQSLFADTLALLDDSDWKNPVLRTLVSQAALSPHLLRHELDIEPLAALGLVRNTFSTIRNRKTTNLIYRQANFNLLREESEGYSKLITEYFNAANAGSTSDLIAEDTFQRIKALVGSFDLDVGRVLDITLDVMANLLIKNFRFFIKYLRASSWWPEQPIPEGFSTSGQGYTSLPAWALPGSGAWSHTQEQRNQLSALKQARDAEFWEKIRKVGMDAFFEVGAIRITNMDSPAVQEVINTDIQPELDSRGREMNRVRRLRTNNARKWMRETGCLVPPGNSDAAQLLGFKLAFYASPARSKQDVLPDNLIYLAAFLIKIGFISLRDLYPHLYPLDEEMAQAKEELEKEKVERERLARPGGGALNALAMAGALADDTLPVPAVRALRDNASTKPSPKPESEAGAEEDKEALPKPANQKIALVKSLLAIGCLPEALYILGRFPWLTDLIHELPDYVHRILHHMLANVYESARPLADRPGLSTARPHIGDPSGLPKGQVNLTPAPPLKTLRWANLDRPDHGDGVEYKFYWDDWADNIPVCQSVDDVFELCGTFLNLIGVKIGRDASLLMKLTRIGKKSLTDDPSEANNARWIDLCKRLLVPSLSLTKHNTGSVNEMFELLKLFPTSVRYSIYSEWHFGMTSRTPDIKAAFDLTKAETKDLLKRISKTNVRAMGKALSKVAFSSPGVVMQVAIHQMESYENLIDVIVECVRYFSMLGYDVLTWCLMNALGGAGRNRVQADGMLTSAWLRALSTFAGSIFKRYSAMDPSPILQYVTHQLRSGNSTDLEILEQIITEMAGIKSDVAYNESQVLAMAGGPVLRAQTLISLLDDRHKMEKPSRRLIKALTEPGLAGQLLIAVAQESQMYAHHTSTSLAPLKVLGNNLDKLYQVFNQYLETLRSNLSPAEFDAAVPDTISLIADFGIEPAIAFMIGRVSIAHNIAESDAVKKAELQEARRSSQAVADVSMTDAEDKDVKMEQSTTEEKTALSLTETDAEMKSVMQANGVDMPTPTPSPESSSHPVLAPLVEKTRHLFGSQFEASISIPFYVTFWTLGLEDILVNTNSYDHELATQSYLLNQINNERTDNTTKGTQEKERRKKAITELREKLTQEMKSQIGAYTQIRNRLNKEKDHWFADFHNKIELLHNSILQNCFLPRIYQSPLDAHYTFMMLKFLHNNGAPGFRTMHLLDRLLRKNQLAALLFQCTPREAENFGRFLSEVMKELTSWHADRAAYEKNAHGVKKQLTGFARKLTPEHTPQIFLDYEEFRNLFFKWHANLNKAFELCFESDEYMHIRNAIIVFKAIAQYFPVVNFMGESMLDAVTKLSKESQRKDIKLAAASTLGDIKKRQSSWVPPQAFRTNKSDDVKPTVPAPKQKSETPASRTSTPLNASAPAFKPPPAAIDSQRAESEDGEIDEVAKKQDPDTKMEDNLPLRKPLPKHEPPPSRVPTPSQANGSRPASTQPPSRTPHGLPSKPETRPPAQHPGRTLQRRHDSRERGGAPEYGRLDRPTDSMRSTPGGPPRETSPTGASRRGRQRSPEYAHRDDRHDYPARPPPMDIRQSEREQYGPARPHPPSRSSDGRGYASGSAAMPPPMPNERGGYDRQDRQDRMERSERQERQSRVPLPTPPSHAQPPIPAVAVNPERLALITGDVPPRDSGRRSRDSSRDDRRGSRTQSPRRAVEVPPPRKEEPRRAPLDPEPFQSRLAGPEKKDEPTPTGPRDRRSSNRPEQSAKPSARELFDPPAPRRPTDPVVQDPNYGRLNAGPADVPLGPKYGGSGQRNYGPPQPVPNGRANEVPPLAPPQSPSNNGRGNGRRLQHDRQSGQYDRQAPPSVPSTPSQQPEVVGVHPSRLAHLKSDQQQMGATGTPPSGAHASRLPHLHQDQQMTGTPPSVVPSGPRGLNQQQATPSGPSPMSRAPAGPRNNNGNQDRRFVGLNDTLQSNNGPSNNNTPNDRGASIRGRAGGNGGGRQSGIMPSPSLPPTPTAIPLAPQPSRSNDPFTQQQQQQQSRSDNSGRHDDRQRRERNTARGDERHGTATPSQAEEFRRSGRSSRDQRGDQGGSYGRGGMQQQQQPTLSSAVQAPQTFAVPPEQSYGGGGRGGQQRYEGEERGQEYRRDGGSGSGSGRERRDESGRGHGGSGSGRGGEGGGRGGESRGDGGSGSGSGRGNEERRSERKRRGEDMGGDGGSKRRRSGI